MAVAVSQTVRQAVAGCLLSFFIDRSFAVGLKFEPKGITPCSNERTNDDRWSMIDDRWSMIDDRWSMIDDRCSMFDVRWSIGDGVVVIVLLLLLLLSLLTSSLTWPDWLTDWLTDLLACLPPPSCLLCCWMTGCLIMVTFCAMFDCFLVVGDLLTYTFYSRLTWRFCFLLVGSIGPLAMLWFCAVQCRRVGGVDGEHCSYCDAVRLLDSRWCKVGKCGRWTLSLLTQDSDETWTALSTFNMVAKQ